MPANLFIRFMKKYLTILGVTGLTVVVLAQTSPQTSTQNGPPSVQIGQVGAFAGDGGAGNYANALGASGIFTTNITITLPNGVTTNLTLIFDPAGVQNGNAGGISVVGGNASYGTLLGNGLTQGVVTGYTGGVVTGFVKTPFGPVVTNGVATNVTGIYPTNIPSGPTNTTGKIPTTTIPGYTQPLKSSPTATPTPTK